MKTPDRIAGICLILLTSSLPFAGQAAGQTVGTAYDLKSEQLLYSETHCLSSEANAREVIYRNDDGAMIARKLVDYSSGHTTPSFVQHNLYSQELIEVSLGEEGVTMSVRGVDQPEFKTITSTRPDAKLPVVIDAGFDAFVRDHWDSLVSGESKRFQFPFAARERLVELRIKPVQCSYSGDSDQCFRLELSNWFLRMLAAPIELGYDADLRRLSRYRGLSNIGDENGKGLVVDIRYDYRDIPPDACRVEAQTLTGNREYFDLSRLSGNRAL